MKEMTQQENNNTEKRLGQIVSLVENAADSIERLRAQLHLCEQRIRELEQSEEVLQHAAERYLRMKSQMEALPEAKGGFTAHGATYPTFDEAFDAAYPVAQAVQEE